MKNMIQKIRRIVLLGPQGSGKGTQGEMLHKRLRVPLIVAGSLVREEIGKRTALGKKIDAIVTPGGYLSSAMMNALMRKRLARADAKKGYVMDGFPRKVGQAVFLARILPPDMVIEITLPERETMRRIATRLQSSCGAIYNLLVKKPKKEGICDVCGDTLKIRHDDDDPASIKRRLGMHRRFTVPMLSYYRKRGVLARVNGNQSIAVVHRDILRAIAQVEGTMRKAKKAVEP